MNNLASSLVKIAALAGGAVLGAVLEYVIEKRLSERMETISEHDRTRYERGLAPIRVQQQQPQNEKE